MSHKEAETPAQDPLADTQQLVVHETPQGVDRRSFLMRTAVGGAAAVMTGCARTPEAANSHGRRHREAGGCCRPSGATAG